MLTENRTYTLLLLGWLSPDPPADKYYSISSYAWCVDNSVAYYRYDDSGKRELKLLGRRSDVYNMGYQHNFINFDEVVLYAGDLATFDRQGFKKHYFVEGRRFLTNVGSVGMPIMDEEHLQELAHSEDIERSSMMFEENLIDYLTTRRNACSYVAASIDIGWLEWMAEWCREILTKEEKNLPYYLHTDRLGSGTVVTNEKGDAVHILTYMPHGETLLDLSQDFETPYQFTGYEKDPESGLYYAGARYHDSDLSMFLSVDRFAEKFPWQSPYCHAGNNPIGNIDLNGDSIVGNIKVWNSNKNNIIRVRDQLARKKRLTSDQKSRLSSLNTTLTTMTDLEKSRQIYCINDIGYGEKGNVILNGTNIDINFAGTTANFVHEVTHAGQFDKGEEGFHLDNGRSITIDIFDEAAAYQAQYSYQPSSVQGLTSSVQGGRSFNTITSSWVRGITMSNGYTPYINTSIYPITINSTLNDLRKARGLSPINNDAFSIKIRNIETTY